MSDKKLKIRNRIIFGIFCGILAVFVGCLVKVQLISGAEYSREAEKVQGSIVKMQAARGEILDRNGIPLVSNRQGYAVNFSYSSFPDEDNEQARNEIIYKVIKLFKAKKQEWIDTLPITIRKGKYVFKANSESETAYLKGRDMLNMNEYATAKNCMDVMIKEYKLSGYSMSDARDIASVYYNMKRMLFASDTPYTFAENVSESIVAIIEENPEKYQGVEIETSLYREYNDGTLAPHILGTVGAIDAEEYEKLKDSGYSMTSDIGKSGIESVMEEYLKGTDGYETVYTNSRGEVVSEITSEPKQGNAVVLTIDSGLQKAAAQALEKTVNSMNVDISSTGAVVVVDVKTGEVLASASYPTYDISRYSEDYEKLIKDEDAPLWNRALLSTYAPGSTAKPSVAIAALEEGIITEADTVQCTGSFHAGDTIFRCDQYHVSSYVNVVNAIKESCNTFFYTMGKRLGIEKMDQYRTLLGLGEKTGLEIEEASGVLDSVAYRESLGQTWFDGLTIQSAIGQAGNLFTPVQLANYCATIANGGTRYKLHLIKNVKTYDLTETVLSKEKPVVACETGFSKSTLDLVREGMKRVGGPGGFCEATFAGLPVAAAAKTGTSQVQRAGAYGQMYIGTNGFLISYAPADNPEIAVAVAIEGAESGTSVSPVAADIYAYYFGLSDNATNVQENDTLLG